MAYEGDAMDIPDADGIGNFEFAEAQIGATGSKDEGEIIGHAEVLSIVHAHANEQLSIGICLMFAAKIMIFQQ